VHHSGALRAIPTQPATATASRLLDDMTEHSTETTRLRRLAHTFQTFLCVMRDRPSFGIAAQLAQSVDHLRNEGARYSDLKILARMEGISPAQLETFLQEADDAAQAVEEVTR
jgi:hypothetical protein